MNGDLQKLTIKQFIQAIDESISETRDSIKKVVILLNQEKDKEEKERLRLIIYNFKLDISRYERQKITLNKIIREHGLTIYKQLEQ